VPDNPLKPEELLQVAALARRYYLEGKSKSDLAEEFKISRFRVARLLDRARESGLVRIEIVLPAHIDAELSARLREAYALRHAIAVDTPDEPEESLRAHLGEVSAGLLSEIVEDGDVLGIAWGRTIQAMTGALTQLARCTVVQLTGAVGRIRVSEDSVEIVRRVAALAGGSSYPIYAPMVVDSAETAAALRRQSHVNEALKCFDRLTKAVVAIGSITPPNSLLYDALDGATRDALRRQGARGETCAIPIDEAGCVVSPEVLDRTIAITPDKLRRVPEVLAVAGGRSKAGAIRAVLAAGFVTSLVTDATTARALLVDPSPPRARKTARARRATSGA
jgi:DNA-binding transcriptional regulator LsrR (DeoR family)